MVGFTVPKPNFRKDSGDVGRNSWQIGYAGRGAVRVPSEQHSSQDATSIPEGLAGELPARQTLKVLGNVGVDAPDGDAMVGEELVANKNSSTTEQR